MGRNAGADRSTERQVGTRGAIEAITNRAPVGAVLTHEQKIQVWNVIHDWIAEVGTDGLGSVMALRDGLEADLPEIGRQRGD